MSLYTRTRYDTLSDGTTALVTFVLNDEVVSHEAWEEMVTDWSFYKRVMMADMVIAGFTVIKSRRLSIEVLHELFADAYSDLIERSL